MQCVDVRSSDAGRTVHETQNTHAVERICDQDRVGYRRETGGLGRVEVDGNRAMAIAILSVALMATLSFAYSTFLVLFLVLGTGAATAWTSLNTLAVQLSPSLRQPVTSVYNAIKFAGYAASPILLSFIYTPLRLTAVQMACIVAMILASLLAFKARQRPPIAPVVSK